MINAVIRKFVIMYMYVCFELYKENDYITIEKNENAAHITEKSNYDTDNHISNRIRYSDVLTSALKECYLYDLPEHEKYTEYDEYHYDNADSEIKKDFQKCENISFDEFKLEKFHHIVDSCIVLSDQLNERLHRYHSKKTKRRFEQGITNMKINHYLSIYKSAILNGTHLGVGTHISCMFFNNIIKAMDIEIIEKKKNEAVEEYKKNLKNIHTNIKKNDPLIINEQYLPGLYKLYTYYNNKITATNPKQNRLRHKNYSHNKTFDLNEIKKETVVPVYNVHDMNNFEHFFLKIKKGKVTGDKNNLENNEFLFANKIQININESRDTATVTVTPGFLVSDVYELDYLLSNKIRYRFTVNRTPDPIYVAQFKENYFKTKIRLIEQNHYITQNGNTKDIVSGFYDPINMFNETARLELDRLSTMALSNETYFIINDIIDNEKFDVKIFNDKIPEIFKDVNINTKSLETLYRNIYKYILNIVDQQRTQNNTNVQLNKVIEDLKNKGYGITDFIHNNDSIERGGSINKKIIPGFVSRNKYFSYSCEKKDDVIECINDVFPKTQDKNYKYDLLKALSVTQKTISSSKIYTTSKETDRKLSIPAIVSGMCIDCTFHIMDTILLGFGASGTGKTSLILSSPNRDDNAIAIKILNSFPSQINNIEKQTYVYISEALFTRDKKPAYLHYGYINQIEIKNTIEEIDEHRAKLGRICPTVNNDKSSRGAMVYTIKTVYGEKEYHIHIIDIPGWEKKETVVQNKDEKCVPSAEDTAPMIGNTVTDCVNFAKDISGVYKASGSDKDTLFPSIIKCISEHRKNRNILEGTIIRYEQNVRIRELNEVIKQESEAYERLKKELLNIESKEKENRGEEKRKKEAEEDALRRDMLQTENTLTQAKTEMENEEKKNYKYVDGDVELTGKFRKVSFVVMNSDSRNAKKQRLYNLAKGARLRTPKNYTDAHNRIVAIKINITAIMLIAGALYHRMQSDQAHVLENFSDKKMPRVTIKNLIWQ